MERQRVAHIDDLLKELPSPSPSPGPGEMMIAIFKRNPQPVLEEPKLAQAEVPIQATEAEDGQEPRMGIVPQQYGLAEPDEDEDATGGWRRSRHSSRTKPRWNSSFVRVTLVHRRHLLGVYYDEVVLDPDASDNMKKSFFREQFFPVLDRYNKTTNDKSFQIN
ncbi:hypothetical protein AC579_7466 [Pseudocercospora musae]|uniref:Uncharacterized protein n=1 Tax=Pseudocercospora musae TaxID=113226 RepID=A0A139H7N8_9PEZI|nr:hypothetical protein AC579_7466 [Pseudocercospora musae]